MKDIIVSLCDYSGEWSRPYREAGFEVIQVDLKYGDDARLWPSKPSANARFPKEFEDIEKYIGRVKGVLAAPMCTVFSGSGAKHPRTDEQILEGLQLVDACIRIAITLEPDFWVIENPVGKLKKWIGPPKLIFNPCDYGDPYTKKTCLWGNFNIPVKTPVEPTEGSKLWKLYGGKSEHTKTMRSVTPAGFAKAFFQANH